MKEIFELRNGNKIWHRIKARNFPESWSSETEVSDFLYGFVRMIKPERVLEIGTFEGDASLAIAKGLRDNKLGHLITTDIKDYGQEKVIEDEGLSRYVTVVKENPKEFLDTVDFTFDMIFIDDGHSYSEVTRDLEVSHRLTKNHSYILGHDVIMIFDVEAAYNRFLEAHPDTYEKIIIENYDGLFILRKMHD